jgi:hypothetical protein
MMMRWLLILTVWLVFILGPLAAVAQEDPTLTVEAPKDGAVLQESSVTVRFEVTDFKLVPSKVPLTEAGKRPEANRPGEGHLHFMLDLQPVVVWERNEPYTFNNVPPGEHRLMVELVNNDHSSLSPSVTKQIRLRTTGPGTMPETGSDAAWQVAGGRTLLVLGVLLVITGGLLLRRRPV